MADLRASPGELKEFRDTIYRNSGGRSTICGGPLLIAFGVVK